MVFSPPEVNSCTYDQLICDKGAKTIQGGKGLFNKWCQDNIKKNEGGPLPLTIYKN